MLNYVQENALLLKHATDKLKEDRDIVLATVTQNGNALGYALKFKGDREVVLAAVRRNGQEKAGGM